MICIHHFYICSVKNLKIIERATIYIYTSLSRTKITVTLTSRFVYVHVKLNDKIYFLTHFTGDRLVGSFRGRRGRLALQVVKNGVSLIFEIENCKPTP
jgi:hypothetical protein